MGSLLRRFQPREPVGNRQLDSTTDSDGARRRRRIMRPIKRGRPPGPA